MNRFELGTLSEDGGDYRHRALHADAQLALAVGEDTDVVIVDVQDGAVRWRLKGHTANVERARFSPDGTRALSVAADGEVRLWDVRSGDACGVVPPAESPVASAVFRADGEWCVVLGKDGTGRIYSTADSREVGRVDASSVFRDGGVEWVEMACPDERTLCIGMAMKEPALPAFVSIALDSGSVRRLDVSPPGVGQKRSSGSYRSFHVRGLSRDGSRMVCEESSLFAGHGWVAEPYLVETQQGTEVPMEDIGGSPAKNVAFSTDGALLAVAYSYRVGAPRVRVVEAATGHSRGDFEVSAGFVSGLALGTGASHVLLAYTIGATLCYAAATLPTLPPADSPLGRQDE